jgi:hypothetical protein
MVMKWLSAWSVPLIRHDPGLLVNWLVSPFLWMSRRTILLGILGTLAGECRFLTFSTKASIRATISASYFEQENNEYLHGSLFKEMCREM